MDMNIIEQSGEMVSDLEKPAEALFRDREPERHSRRIEQDA